MLHVTDEFKEDVPWNTWEDRRSSYRPARGGSFLDRFEPASIAARIAFDPDRRMGAGSHLGPVLGGAMDLLSTLPRAGFIASSVIAAAGVCRTRATI